MGLKTEQLTEEVKGNLINLQNELNELVYKLGQVNLQIRDIENELNSSKDLRDATIQQYDMQLTSFNRILADLEQKHPNGRIDLEAGTVEWEVQE